MYDNAPVRCLTILKWLTVLFLFVLTGCLFVTIRANHEATRDRIVMLDKQVEEIHMKTKSVRASVKTALGPNTLAGRLRMHESSLNRVGVERTEPLEVLHTETVLRHFP
jgi:hypothetical protein